MVMLTLRDRALGASIPIPGCPKVAFGAGPCAAQEADALDRGRLGIWWEQKQGLYEKVIWPLRLVS